MSTNGGQREFWSETVGDIWVTHAQAVDATFASVLQAVLDRAALQPGARVLDIGCGAGVSSFAAADLVGDQGHVLGVDVSHPLLDAAKLQADQASNVDFVLADAQTYAPDGPPFDVMISRFGVMFFDDTVAAFKNIAAALRPGAQLAFATWGTIAENPFFTLPAAVSKAHFGPMPKSDPDAPGPFAMREPDKVIALLSAAGLTGVEVNVMQMQLTPPGSVEDLAKLLCEIGPAKGALEEYQPDASGQAAFMEVLTDALRRFEGPDGLRIPAEINIFSAQKPSD